MELFSNFGATKINGAINNTVTSILVNDASVYPSTGNFRIVSDDEIMLVTAVSGNTLTVLRGQEGTTAIAHADASDIIHVLTKGSLAAFRSDSIIRDTYANRPTAGVAGRLYLETDYGLWAYDDGSNWNVFGRMWNFVPPIDSQFAWVNQQAATVTTTQDSIDLYSAGNMNGVNIRKKAAPATPYTITAFAAFNLQPTSFYSESIGLLWRNSTSGKFVTFGVNCGQNLFFGSSQWNSPTNSNADYSGFVGINDTPFQFLWGTGSWIRITDDGTTRKGFLSNDGKNWMIFQSQTHTDFMTPDEVGFYVNAYNQSVSPDNSCLFRLFSWEET